MLESLSLVRFFSWLWKRCVGFEVIASVVQRHGGDSSNCMGAASCLPAHGACAGSRYGFKYLFATKHLVCNCHQGLKMYVSCVFISFASDWYLILQPTFCSNVINADILQPTCLLYIVVSAKALQWKLIELDPINPINRNVILRR